MKLKKQLICMFIQDFKMHPIMPTGTHNSWYCMLANLSIQQSKVKESPLQGQPGLHREALFQK